MNGELKGYQDPSRHHPRLLLPLEILHLILKTVNLGPFFYKKITCMLVIEWLKTTTSLLSNSMCEMSITKKGKRFLYQLLYALVWLM